MAAAPRAERPRHRGSVRRMGGVGAKDPTECRKKVWNETLVMDETESLDQHRGMAAQQATEERRRTSEVMHDQLALKKRREELEKFLFAEPAGSWDAAVAKTRYLLTLFAETPTADDPRYRTLVEQVLADFDHLLLAAATANDNNTDTR